MDLNEIEWRFAFHPATTAEKQAEHGTARDTLKSAAERLLGLLPEGREKSLAITKLEEAMFWANAAIAREN